MHTCSICGNDNQISARFCSSCGSALNIGNNRMLTGFLPSQSLLSRGRYQILEVVGKGGMAAVYKALDLQLGKRVVAIKEMSQHGLVDQALQEAIAAFEREAEVLANLKHRSLPQIYEQFEDGGRRYLVMEFIEGETLEQRLLDADKQGNSFSIEQVLDIGKQLCIVLGYLHTRQPPIIFRDLKPANIMLDAQDQIYLIDFGIARLFKSGQKKDTAALGSPGYAPPEQYRRATSPRSDIYSLGVVLHQVLTGSDPSLSPFFFQPFSVNIPALESLTQRMVSLDEKLRPATMLAVHKILNTIDPPGHSRTATRKRATHQGMSKQTRTPQKLAAVVPATTKTLKIYTVGSPYPEDQRLWENIQKQLFSLTGSFLDVSIEGYFLSGKALNGAIDTADMIVLLLSNEFLSSTDCMVVAHQAIDQYEMQGTPALAVVLRSCSLAGSRLDSLKRAPDDAVFHLSLYAQEQKTLEVARAIRRVLVTLVMAGKTTGPMNLLQWVLWQVYGEGRRCCPYFTTGQYTMKYIHPSGLAGILVLLFDNRRDRHIAKYVIKPAHSPDLSHLLKVIAPSATDPRAVQGVASRRRPLQ